MSLGVLTPSAAPFKATTSPIVTGSSVLGIKYRDGVMMAADTLGSYGSMAKFTDLRRLRKVGSGTLLGASGEYSDFQYIMDLLDEITREEALLEDRAALGGPEILSFLTRVMYNRRNKMNPLWNTILVAGVEEGKSTLGYVDLRGTAFSEDYLATGFGAHMALPLIRERWRADMDEASARTLLEDCLRVLWYRDCRALNKVQIAKVTAGGVAISEPFTTSAKWDYNLFVTPKAGADTGGSW